MGGVGAGLWVGGWVGGVVGRKERVGEEGERGSAGRACVRAHRGPRPHAPTPTPTPPPPRSILAIVFLILLVVTAFITIALTYFQVRWESVCRRVCE